MNCSQKSYDGNITVESTGDPDGFDGRNSYSRNGSPWQLEALQQRQPELFQKDINTINAKLVEDNLLPGLKVIAMRDENGIDRDAEGQPVMRSVDEIRTLAADESRAIDKTADAYSKAFDDFHQGFDGNNPLQMFWPAELTRENIQQSLARTDLSSQDKTALQGLKDDFVLISTNRGKYDTITKDEIALWQNGEQESLSNKLDAFVTQRPVGPYTPNHQDANGKISIFDWNSKRDCVVNYNGPGYGPFSPRDSRGFAAPMPGQAPEKIAE